MSHRALLLALTVLSVGPGLASAQSPLTRISSEEVVIPLADAVGTSRVPFLIEANTPEPRCIATDAAGQLNTIPAQDIALAWLSGFPSTAARTPATLEIRVVTAISTEPGVDYVGKVLCFWSKSTPSMDFSFKVKPQPVADFSMSPETLDIVVGPGMPGEARLSIRNTGRTTIRQVSASSLGLTDPATRASVGSFDVPKQQLPIVPIAPGEEREFSFSLPRPVMAGAYTGQLSVLVNGRVSKTPSLTVRTRGPNRIPLLSRCSWFDYMPRLPFLLFLVTLIAGYGVSLLLESWFAGGGLQRATAIRSLYGSLQALEGVAEQVRNWESQNGPAFTQTEVRRDLLAKEISGLLLRPDSPQSQLTESASRAEQAIPFYQALWSAVGVASQRFHDRAHRLAAVQALDAIKPGSDFAAYRNALEEAIEKSAASTEKAAALLAAGVVTLPLDPAAVAKQLATIQRKMRAMEWLQRGVVWVAVFGTAYLTFLFGKFSFGTLQDYINVFFWSVGLTQTGSQVLAKVRSGRS